MAYTYDDVVRAANNAGVMDRFSQSDLTAAKKNPEYGLSMVSLLKDVSKATTAEQRLLATEAANQMRKNYGVYGSGADAAGYTYNASYGSTIDDLMKRIKNYGSFDYANQDAYQKLLDSVANQSPFRYDYSADPSYSAYKKEYLREGDRASANALAQASAASGGRASSYAMTAANQAGNYYAGQLADAIPVLEQSAYQRYLDDFSSRLNGLSAMQNDRAFDYENWMNEYNMLQNSLGNYQGQDATDYQRYLDSYNRTYQAERDRAAQAQQEYENQQAAKQQEYNNALALYQTMGYATPEVARILGVSAGPAPSGGSAGSAGVNSSSGGNTGASGGSGGNTEPGDAYVDLNSVMGLGYGPINEDELARLIQTGEVEMYQEGGKIKFRKTKKSETGPGLPVDPYLSWKSGLPVDPYLSWKPGGDSQKGSGGGAGGSTGTKRQRHMMLN